MGEQRDMAVVKTYVPADQKEEWREHAGDLDMSQSEFVRTMVQAGRRGFGEEAAEGEFSDATPGVDGLKEQVLAALPEEGYRSWSALREQVADGLDDRLEAALRELQNEGSAAYSARNGGYTRDE